jgi:uncharacterized protein YkwD
MSACAMAAAIGLSLAGCQPAPQASSGQPSFYANLGSPAAKVDAEMARAMISAYRLRAGQSALVLDPALGAAAAQAAGRMAAADKPASADALKAELAGRGLTGTQVNVSAGYRNLAEAFSGWRDSPQHDKVMKAPGVTRIGIATAYAPGSKYQVYWTLILAP